MSNILLHPCYFGSIANYVAIINNDIVFENYDNFQKQTLRNRSYIYGANGKLLLNLPILHQKKGYKQLYRDTKIEHQFNSLTIHWKSLQSAYRTSPYFEFYEDELAPLFESKPEFLLDFNYQCHEFILESLQIEKPIQKTEEYIKEVSLTKDYRYLVNPKDQKIGSTFDSYTQVFVNKHGFIPNLSILDLLFNEGPNAISYLEKQQL